MHKLKAFYKRHETVVLYVIVGGLAALLGCFAYLLFRHLFPSRDSVFGFIKPLYNHSVTLFPSILSWLFAATFAYAANRMAVFHGNVKGFAANLRQVVMFYRARLLTLGLDSLILFIFIDIIGIADFRYEAFIKIMSNILIAVLNYFISKFIVFRHKSSRGKDD